MNEKLYKKVKRTGALGITIGVMALVFGIVSGILLIVNGGRLLAHKSDTLF